MEILKVSFKVDLDTSFVLDFQTNVTNEIRQGKENESNTSKTATIIIVSRKAVATAVSG